MIVLLLSVCLFGGFFLSQPLLLIDCCGSLPYVVSIYVVSRFPTNGNECFPHRTQSLLCWFCHKNLSDNRLADFCSYVEFFFYNKALNLNISNYVWSVRNKNLLLYIFAQLAFHALLPWVWFRILRFKHCHLFSLLLFNFIFFVFLLFDLIIFQ